MSANALYKQPNGGGWLRVFIPHARCLTDQEMNSLPEQQRKDAEGESHEGVWLKVHCPENICLTDDGKVILPAKGVSLPEKKGLWLRLFCPEERCLIDDYTHLP
jgi:hypothetical protein